MCFIIHFLQMSVAALAAPMTLYAIGMGLVLPHAMALALRFGAEIFAAEEVLKSAAKVVVREGGAGGEPDDELIAHMAAHPTLLERPIGIADGRAAVGRPPENLLELVEV